MLVTISTTHQPATDLGYLLHKHPGRVQSFELSHGLAHVFYPEATETRCTAAMALEIDPVGLVRGSRPGHESSGPLAQYVNDRPYVASSLMAVAISTVFRTAISGKCATRPDLPAQALPLEVEFPAVPCRGGEAMLRELFEPLGYEVRCERLSEQGPGLYRLRLTQTCLLSEFLTHLYVLIPVLDGEKHYWVAEEEVEKLLRHGEGWLSGHPLKELIAARYLRRRPGLVRLALERLLEETDADGEAESSPIEKQVSPEESIERPLRLNDLRIRDVLAALQERSPATVLDLGCGEGRLLRQLARVPGIRRIVGLDAAHRSLETARQRLDRLPPSQKERVELLHGALTYRDDRLSGFDAAAVVEVIEHLDPPRLGAFERVLFEFAAPARVVITTPNAEFNSHWPSLPAGKFRHPDHRFEWDRAQCRTWAEGIGARYGYRWEWRPVGEPDPDLGPPTQLLVFDRLTSAAVTVDLTDPLETQGPCDPPSSSE